MERCSPVYHHDNDADGDVTIGESFGGVGRIGTKCGIFFDNDQVNIHSEWCSPAITIDITMFNNYHDCNGDVGNIYQPVFGCPLRDRDICGLFYDNDLVSVHNECGSRLSKN